MSNNFICATWYTKWAQIRFACIQPIEICVFVFHFQTKKNVQVSCVYSFIHFLLFKYSNFFMFLLFLCSGIRSSLSVLHDIRYIETVKPLLPLLPLLLLLLLFRFFFLYFFSLFVRFPPSSFILIFLHSICAAL